jgi:phosphoribosylformylglycinamidine synthase
MKTPVTGGNVSLYNETVDADGNPQPIYPTPVIGMVGLIPDITKVCGQGWQEAGDLIYLLGMNLGQTNIESVQVQDIAPTPHTPHPHTPTLGASEYLASIHKIIAGKPPKVDFDRERRVQEACRYGIRQGWVRSAHDCAEGGLAVALAECCISNQFGAKIHLSTTTRWDRLLFGEAASSILVSVKPEIANEWEFYLNKVLENKWHKIGSVAEKEGNLEILTDDNQDLINVKIDDIKACWLQAIEKRLKV